MLTTNVSQSPKMRCNNIHAVSKEPEVLNRKSAPSGDDKGSVTLMCSTSSLSYLQRVILKESEVEKCIVKYKYFYMFSPMRDLLTFFLTVK